MCRILPIVSRKFSALKAFALFELYALRASLYIALWAPTQKRGVDSMRKIKAKFSLIVIVLVAVGLMTGCAYNTKDLNEQSVLGINWVQTSAEYRALCYQSFNLSKMNLDAFLATYSPIRRSWLARILDIPPKPGLPGWRQPRPKRCRAQRRF
jgi:hypothetical protein